MGLAPWKGTYLKHDNWHTASAERHQVSLEEDKNNIKQVPSFTHRCVPSSKTPCNHHYADGYEYRLPSLVDASYNCLNIVSELTLHKTCKATTVIGSHWVFP